MHFNTSIHKDMKFTFLDFLFFLFMFLTTGYALNTVRGTDLHLMLIIPISIYFVLALCKKVNFKMNILMMFLVLFFGLFINGEASSYTLKLLIVILFSCVIVQIYEFDKFRKYFVKSMVIISIISLVGHIYCVYINPSPSFPIITNVTGVKYYNAFVFFETVGYTAGRNMGCFWEPGIFGSFLLLAMMFSILDNDNVKLFDIIVLSLTIITSLSTAAYLLDILVLSLLFVKKLEKVTIKRIVLFIIFIIFVVLIFINRDIIVEYLVKIQPRVFGKLVNETASSTVRLESPFVNLSIFTQHPILGVGLNNVGELYSNITDISQTSTTTYMMASFGFIGVLITIFQCIGILFYKEWNFFSRIVFFIVFFSIINKEPHMFFTITWIINLYFISDLFLYKKDNRKVDDFEYKKIH